MPLFTNNNSRVLFIHIPKTAGTSVELMLCKYYAISFHSEGFIPALRVTPQHLQISDIKVMLDSSFWDYSFAIVRNPYSRLESEYFYQMDKRSLQFQKYPDFSNWVLNHIDRVKKNRFHLDNHLRPQYEFIDSDVEIFKFEAGIDFIIKELSKKLEFKEPGEIIKTNISNKTEVNWSLNARTQVNNFYKNDFKFFKYEKIEPTVNISPVTSSDRIGKI